MLEWHYHDHNVTVHGDNFIGYYGNQEKFSNYYEKM